ncbi:MAG: ABC transporter ATP-binding protein [Muribaculaceae bacterium]|nr:ABC transporter ATP-binding protein [Muribaculaceae bacterium]
MLEINKLTFSYRRSSGRVLDGFSLNIGDGGIYGLLGPNGAGKSTLLYLVAGLLTPASGSVTLNGVNTRRRIPSTMAEMFIVPEEFDLPKMKLSRFIKANAPLYPRFSVDDMRRHLDVFGMADDLNTGELSMGQKKKVYLSFALATNVPLVLMDEPTNGLDIPGKDAFRRFIAGGMTDEKSIVLSTHQVWDVESLLDHIIIMDKSRVVLDQSVVSIMERLKFSTVNDRASIGAALYAHPTAGGTDIITLNNDGSETAPDLEMLFNFATERPGSVEHIFNKP